MEQFPNQPTEPSANDSPIGKDDASHRAITESDAEIPQNDDDDTQDLSQASGKPAGKLVRLNKLIADSGVASRRAADRIIEEGEVTVNGKKVYELGTKVDPQNDKILINGKPIRRKFEHIYVMFHKPKGVLTTMEDPMGRPTVRDFMEKIPARVFPVGRLDWDSEGLLILTNDGDYANKVTNPKSEVTKTYLVKVDGQPPADKLNKLLTGVTIETGKVKAKSVEKVERGRDQYDWIKIVITEGKNRQIRQMFAKIGFDVLKLQRVAIGRLRLGSLKRGEMVFLNDVAAQRVFLVDNPEVVAKKKSYKGRHAFKKTESKKVRDYKARTKQQKKPSELSN